MRAGQEEETPGAFSYQERKFYPETTIEFSWLLLIQNQITWPPVPAEEARKGSGFSRFHCWWPVAKEAVGSGPGVPSITAYHNGINHIRALAGSNVHCPR